jgi:hypothetical protein
MRATRPATVPVTAGPFDRACLRQGARNDTGTVTHND